MYLFRHFQRELANDDDDDDDDDESLKLMFARSYSY